MRGWHRCKWRWALGLTCVALLTGRASAAPLCGEASCQPLVGALLSWYEGDGCTGAETYWLDQTADRHPRSWDGGGLAGTVEMQGNPKSYRDTNGTCHVRSPQTLFDGFVRLYRCPAAHRQCATECVPSTGCCTVADCTAPPPCSKLPARSCKSGVCTYSVDDGAPCDADGTRCTPNDRCQGGTCVADPSVVACVPKDCNAAACDPATGNCVYTPVDGSCGGAGCFSAGTCAGGVCSGAPKDCSALTVGQCKAPACDATTGACVAENVPNDVPCTVDSKCVESPACSGGVCVGRRKSCQPSSSCRVAECDDADGTCRETTLPVGTPCAALDSCAEDGVCASDGTCDGAALPDGTPCSLKTTCTDGAPACRAGRCRCPGDPDPGEPADLGTGAAGGDDGGCELAARPRGSGLLLGGLVAALWWVRRGRRAQRAA